jgi:hypothetical protein
MVAGGGALGGFLVTVVAPRVLRGFWEYHFGLLATTLLVIWVLFRSGTRGEAAASGRRPVARFIEQLGRTGVPHIVVSFGNPYLISSFPETQAYMLAWNGSEASQRAAARALLGAFEVGGRVPTGIPPLFVIGDGLRVPMKLQAAGGS